MKFVLDRKISDKPVSYLNRLAGANDSLANQLFEIDGVASLFWLHDFLTVNKVPAVKWPAITRRVKKILADCATEDEIKNK